MALTALRKMSKFSNNEFYSSLNRELLGISSQIFMLPNICGNIQSGVTLLCLVPGGVLEIKSGGQWLFPSCQVCY